MITFVSFTREAGDQPVLEFIDERSLSIKETLGLLTNLIDEATEFDIYHDGQLVSLDSTEPPPIIQRSKAYEALLSLFRYYGMAEDDLPTDWIKSRLQDRAEVSKAWGAFVKTAIEFGFDSEKTPSVSLWLDAQLSELQDWRDIGLSKEGIKQLKQIQASVRGFGWEGKQPIIDWLEQELETLESFRETRKAGAR